MSQTRHAFNFGGSLASDWQAPKQDWYDDFKAQFANLFNYATIDFIGPSMRKSLADGATILILGKNSIGRKPGYDSPRASLMWHEVLPDFMTDSERDTSAIEADIVRHVDRLLTNFPEIDEWDVYNEAPGIKWRSKKEGVRRWFESVGGPSEGLKNASYGSLLSIRMGAIFSTITPTLTWNMKNRSSIVSWRELILKL